MHRRHLRCGDSIGSHTALIRLWCLRALNSLVGQIRLSERIWADDAIAVLIGVDPDNAQFTTRLAPIAPAEGYASGAKLA